MKKCPKCGVDKRKSEYHKNKNYKDGLASRCKSCVKKDLADYRKKNPEKIRKKKAKAYARDKLEISKKRKAKVRAKPKRNTNTYLLECEGFLKIGVANDVYQRVRHIQTGNPFEVKVLAVVDANIELHMHDKFSHLRSRGEWFYGCDAIVEEFMKWS